MANWFNLELDTTGPSSPSVSFDDGVYATQQLVNVTVGTGDGDTTGYQMKLYGDVDLGNDADVQDIEANSNWIAFNASKQIKLASGDGSKTLYVKIRDDVLNESGEASDNITLDTTLPTVNITGPDLSKISKIATKDVSAFSFQSDSDFTEYKVKVVAASGSAHDTGTLIGTANGSTFMADTGTWNSSTVINSSINGADLEAASAGDGTKIVKVFVKDDSGQWSV